MTPYYSSSDLLPLSLSMSASVIPSPSEDLEDASGGISNSNNDVAGRLLDLSSSSEDAVATGPSTSPSPSPSSHRKLSMATMPSSFLSSLSASLPSILSISKKSSPNRERWQRAIQQFQERQEGEVQAILTEMEALQHDVDVDVDVVADPYQNNNYDESDDDIDNYSQRRKEYTVRNYPNGNLFSGNIDAKTQLPIYGRMTYASQMMEYEGPFRNGERHGHGATCVKVDGSAKFLGRYEGGQMRSGTLIVPTYTYTGTFVNEDFHGVGTMVSSDGSIYQGWFEHGEYHGVGTLRTTIDDANDDNENNDRGGGKRKEREESVYVGDFVEGVFHGYGTLNCSDGSSYVGSWHGGKRVTGIESLSNGDVFEGPFVNDLREGRGALTTKGGRMTMCGVWKGGKLQDAVDLSIAFENGHCYCGDHADSVPHGKSYAF